MSSRTHWKKVDGVLRLDKPPGMTSNAALQAARRLFGAAKAGHTGTLDPMATGLLPLCFGEATKFSADLLNADKTYEAEIYFGVTTTTGDAEGEVLERRPVHFSLAELEAALGGLRGKIHQVPPMYSALKCKGKPLYELARQGIVLEREAREVTIQALELLDFSGEYSRLRIRCSKGTYIRVLAEDIGRALACGAHLSALRRTEVGTLQVATALTLEEITAVPEEDRATCLLPFDALLQSLPAVVLDETAATRFLHGNPISCEAPAGSCRVYDVGGRLLGLGAASGSGELRPRRVVCR